MEHPETLKIESEETALESCDESKLKVDHSSAFTPYKPSTVLTNLQRGNVPTQTVTVYVERSIHQLAAIGELFFNDSDEVFEPNMLDKNGFTPLMWAAAYGQLDTVRQLLILGSNASAVTPTGESSLIFASSAGHCAIIKLLLRYGAPIDYKDKAGNTALMYAAFNDHVACVKELLSAGSDFTILNDASESAYDISIRRRSKKAITILERCAIISLAEANVDPEEES